MWILLLLVATAAVLATAASGSAPPMRNIRTVEFDQYISSPKYSLLHFYDPNSRFYINQNAASFQQLGAMLLRFSEKVQIAQVNVQSDGFLLYRLAPKLVWRHNARQLFSFGEDPFHVYPSTIRLFREGRLVDEFVGDITHQALVRFVTLHLAGGKVVRLDGTRVSASSLPFPRVLGCMQDGDMLEPLARELSGKAYFGAFVNCSKPGAVSRGEITLQRDEDTPKVQLEIQAACLDTAALQKSLSPFFLRLTPENIWYFTERYSHLAVVFDAALLKSRLVGITGIQFVSCDYELFSTQFQAQARTDIILYDTNRKELALFANYSEVRQGRIDAELDAGLRDLLQASVDEFVQVQPPAPSPEMGAETGPVYAKFLQAHSIIVMWFSQTHPALQAAFPYDLRALMKEHQEWAADYFAVLQLVWFKQMTTRRLLVQPLTDLLAFLRKLETGVMQTTMDAFYNQVEDGFILRNAEEPAVGTVADTYLDIPRVAYDNLSNADFLRDYAEKRIPVIITGMPSGAGEGITLENILRVCGDTKPDFANAQRTQQQRAAAQPKSLRDFLLREKNATSEENWYLEDFSLPASCPDLIFNTEFAIPKYVAGDMLQRTSSNLQHIWPTLSIRPLGLEETKLGVGKMGAAVASYLAQTADVSTARLWTIYGHTNETFLPDLLSRPLDMEPRRNAHIKYRGEQREGELLIIPGANQPHSFVDVGDEEDTTATAACIVSWEMQFVHNFNFVEHLQAALMRLDLRHFHQMTQPEVFPFGSTSKQQDLSFAQFKSERWLEIPRDLQDL